MLFNSEVFVIFFVVVMFLYFLLRDYRRQNVMLLIASYIFYGAWDWRFLSLIIFSTTVDFLVSQRLDATHEARKRRLLLTLSVGANLSVLGFFKYYNFFIDSFAYILGNAGFHPDLPTLQIILPVGISFYTFQTMGYTIDVYRKERSACRDPISFALFVAFFPQLVAGPIERSTHLLPQLERPRSPTRDDFKLGLMWVLLGYFKKVIIADTLAPLVDYAFTHPDEVGGSISLTALLAFTIQIYGDFAGYTLIARGISRWMGIDIMENFDHPYLARNPREFWTRWHISLSLWMRRYLYFSLGGNRRGKARTYLNLMITMCLAGLWHGASWNFIIWGAYFGFLVVLCHMLGLETKRAPLKGLRTLIEISVTFVLSVVGWLFFRASSLHQLSAIVENIATNIHSTEGLSVYLKPTLAMFFLVIIYHVWQERAGDNYVLLHVNRWVRYGIYCFIIITLFSVRSTLRPFVYFQF